MHVIAFILETDPLSRMRAIDLRNNYNIKHTSEKPPPPPPPLLCTVTPYVTVYDLRR